MSGYDHGDQTLVYGDSCKEAGRFDREHLVFAGINSLYEGITICYPCPVILPEKTEPEKILLESEQIIDFFYLIIVKYC